MDTETTKNNMTDDDCKCGCKEGVCMCENCTAAECDCADCKVKNEAPAETPVA